MGLRLSGNRHYCPPDAWDDLQYAAYKEQHAKTY